MRRGGTRSRGSRWLGLLSRLVPVEARAAWRQEWEGELAWARSAGSGAGRVVLAGLEDALRLWLSGVRARGIGGDLRYATRSLARHPAFTASAILTLGLGIGANTAVFSVVEAYLLRPLPVLEPDRLVMVLKGTPQAGATSAPDFVDWRERSHSFEDLAAIHLWSANMVGGDVPVRVTRARVSPSFFELLGVRLERGRDFQPEEGQPGRDREVILSHELWVNGFGGDPEIVGRTVRVDDVECTVIGVAPAGLRVPPFTTQIWVPLALDEDMLSARGRNNLYVIGRLRAGESLEAAQASMAAIGESLSREFPQTNEAQPLRVQPLRDFVLGSAPGPLWRLLCAVGLVLLLACVNVANLVIARGAAREREIAVRASLGASRARLVAHLLTESALIGVSGGALGLLVAYGALGPIRRLVPASLAAAGNVSLDGRVLLVTMVAGILTGLAAGLLPALRLSGTGERPLARDVSTILRDRGGTSRVRASLAVAQYALATMLLIASALVLRSLGRLYAADTGIDYAGVTTFGVTFPEASFGTSERVRQAVDEVLDRVGSTPGVESAAAVSHLPLTGSRLTSSVLYEGGPTEHSATGAHASIKVVTPGYFEMMGVRLLEGRTFDDHDRQGSEPVVVINRKAAAAFWPGESAIGRWISYTDGPDGKPLQRRVVGVIGDILFAGPASPPIEEVYEVHRQTTDVWRWFGRSMTFVVRTSNGTLLDSRAARAAVAAVDGSLPIIGYGLLTDRLDATLATPRFNGALLGAFGAIALGLAGIGMYGVLAFSVRRRTRELGIRVALGAGRRALIGGVLADGFRLALTGIAAGLVAALAAGRLLRALVWGVDPRDPLTLAMAVVVLAAATLLASWLPARRAASVDPVRSLRSD